MTTSARRPRLDPKLQSCPNSGLRTPLPLARQGPRSYPRDELYLIPGCCTWVRVLACPGPLAGAPRAHPPSGLPSPMVIPVRLGSDPSDPSPVQQALLSPSSGEGHGLVVKAPRKQMGLRVRAIEMRSAWLVPATHVFGGFLCRHTPSGSGSHDAAVRPPWEALRESQPVVSAVQDRAQVLLPTCSY